MLKTHSLSKITPNQETEVEEVTYDSEAGESQVLKRPRFAHSVQKRVKKKRDVSGEKGRPGEEQRNKKFIINVTFIIQ